MQDNPVNESQFIEKLANEEEKASIKNMTTTALEWGLLHQVVFEMAERVRQGETNLSEAAEYALSQWDLIFE